MAGEAIGRRLRKVVASTHLFEGKLDDAPINLWLFFEGLAPLRVFGVADGWRLSADRSPPEPFDMDESGEVVLSDVSVKTVLGAVIDKNLEGAWIVKSPEGEVVGIRFDFGLSSKPLILNRDDELLVLDEFPSDAGEEITETRVRPVALK